MLTTKIVHVEETAVTIPVGLSDLISYRMLPGDAINVVINNCIALRNVPLYSGGCFCRIGGVAVVVNDKSNSAKIMIRGGDLALTYGLEAGNTISLEPGVRGKYHEEDDAYSIDRLNRSAYDNDEDFAGFRRIFETNTAFYRSASPFDNAYGRAPIALECALRRKVKTIIDVADDNEDLRDLLDEGGEELHDKLKGVKVFAMGNTTNVISAEFAEMVVRTMELLATEETPILVCCRAGLRRVGYISAMLLALCGESYEEIAADFMLGYRLNKGVVWDDDPKRYRNIETNTINAMVAYLQSLSPGVEMEPVGEAVKKYLLKNGMNYELLAKLKRRLP